MALEGVSGEVTSREHSEVDFFARNRKIFLPISYTVLAGLVVYALFDRTDKVAEHYGSLPQSDIIQRYDSNYKDGELDREEVRNLLNDYELVERRK